MNTQKLVYQNIFWRGLFFLSGFILNIFIARHFDAAVTGWIYYLFTLFSFFTLIMSFSLESAIIYFGSKNEILLNKLAVFAWIWVLLAAAGITLIYTIVSLSGHSAIVPEYKYAVLFICGNLLVTFMTALFYAGKNYVTSNVCALLVNIGLLLLLFFTGKQRIISDDNFINIYFSSFLVLGILLSILNAGRFLSMNKPVISKRGLRKLFRYSVLVFLANLVFFLLYKIDYWFVNRYCTPAELGNYIQVSKVAQMFFVLPGMLAGSIFPLIAGNEMEKVAEHLKLFSRSIFFFYLLACIFLAITGWWIFPLAFGETFGDMYTAFLWLIPGILALSTLYTLTAYFSGVNKVLVNLKGSLLAIFVIIAGDAFLIPVYGINGAAFVSSAGYIVYHWYVLASFNRLHKSGVADFFYFRMSDFHTLKRSVLGNLKRKS